jgi:outer membrane protein assembly factor BamB
MRYALPLAFLVLAAADARAFGFGLGAAAAKRSAAVLDKAAASQPAAASTATVPSRVLWSYSGEPVYYASPALTDGGTVYFATSHSYEHYLSYWNQGQAPPPLNYGLYAYDSSGTFKWRYSDGTNAPARGSPVIGADGTIYYTVERLGASLATSSIELHAVKPDGTQRWKLTVSTCDPEIGSLTPALAADGTIYLAGRDVTAFHPDGSIKWRLYASQSPTSVYFGAPSVASDGTLYTVYWTTAGAGGQVLLALNPDGTERARSPNLGTYPLTGSPVIAGDGTVYMGIQDQLGLSGAQNGALLAFTSTGAIKWAFPAGDFDVRSPPTLAVDGTIYFGTKGNSGFVYALDSDGNMKWRYATIDDAGCACGVDVYNSPAVGADGTVYVNNEFGILYAFNPDGTILFKDAVAGGLGGGANWSSGLISPSGTFFTGKTYGAFVAVKTSSLGPAASAWPRYHRTNDNAGRAP